MSQFASAATDGGRGPVTASPDLAASKILVIDDDPALLRLVELIAAENGYQVVTATTGAAGLRLTMESDPD
ncbi:MAG: response regulator, partial [Candidatus Dormibacteria bacterium]